MTSTTRISAKLKGLTMVTFLLLLQTWSLSQGHSFSKSKSNIDLQATLKGFSPARSILDMRRKVLNLEVSVDEQRGLIEKLTDEVESLKDVISGHADAYGDLEEFATGDTNIFAESHESCGGVLVGQSGSITFTSDALKNTQPHPTSCTWTVRANNRRTIKVALQPSNSSRSSSKLDAYVVELMWKKDAKNDTIFSNEDLKTKITKLEKEAHTFTGPVIFVVYPLPAQKDASSQIDLRLHYEGFDKLVEKTTLFAHENLQGDSGDFNDSHLDLTSHTQMQRHSYFSAPTYSMVYTSLVISNFSTKVHLQAVLENGREICGQQDISFLVITDVLETDVTITNCCETSCAGKNSLVNYDSPFIIIIRRRLSEDFKFNLRWEADILYPSSSSSNEECGEILGGTSGTLRYKSGMNYKSGERCIWVISPQPSVRQSIVLAINSNGVDDAYDNLYMMELVGVNGTASANGPRITKLPRGGGTYYAYSREVYIVFFSTYFAAGKGFSINWRCNGDKVKDSSDVTTRFTILKAEEGVMASSSERPYLFNELHQVFLLTPSLSSSLKYKNELNINQTQSLQNSGCLGNETSVYAAVDGVITKSNLTGVCSLDNKASSLALENDGMAVIVVARDSADDSQTTLNYSWRDIDELGINSYSTIEDNKCGGVINKNQGVLKYKIMQNIQSTERCIWLLHTANHNRITLKLLRDGLDHIWVTKVDPNSGKLLNDTSVINRQNRVRIYKESMLVLVFQAQSHSNQRHGFAIMFSGDGERKIDSESEYAYQLQHLREPFGALQYPSLEWEKVNPRLKNIFIAAYTLDQKYNVDPRTMQTKLSWIPSSFKKHNNTDWCHYKAATFYTVGINKRWLQSDNIRNDNNTEPCTDADDITAKTDNTLTLPDTAFLMIYKHSAVKMEEQKDLVPEIGFSYKTAAGCGGVVKADAGVISYKENGRYFNLEECIWLVHAPKANKIGLQLEKSSFEDCCDWLTVLKINSVTGNPEQQAVMKYNRNITVDGPMLIIIFDSDGSKVGNGFRLTFRTVAETPEPFTTTFNLVQRSQPRLKETFILNTKSNEITILAYSPELLTENNNRGIPQVTLQTFRPEVDENCSSDNVTIYQVYRGLQVAASYTAINVLKNDGLSKLSKEIQNGTCSMLESSNFSLCQNSILNCSDTPNSNVIPTGNNGFVIVSRGANSAGNVHNRGLALNVDVTN